MLDLKGVRRTEQNALLDIFLAKTSTMRELSDTSFLSTMDMEPNLSASLAQPTSPAASMPAPGGLFTGALGGFSMITSGSNSSSLAPSRTGTPLLAQGQQQTRGVSFGDLRPGGSDGFSGFKKLGGRLFGQQNQS